jgi:hypothetical protein
MHCNILGIFCQALPPVAFVTATPSDVFSPSVVFPASPSPSPAPSARTGITAGFAPWGANMYGSVGGIVLLCAL